MSIFLHIFFLSWCGDLCFFFFFSSRRRHTRSLCDWSSDVCSSDLLIREILVVAIEGGGDAVADEDRGERRIAAAHALAAAGDVRRRAEILRGEQIGRGACRERG